MKTSIFISSLLIAIGVAVAQPSLSGEYDFCSDVLMVTDTNLLNTTIYYQLCYSIRQPNIFFGLVCEIDGWCGVGVSNTGFMVGTSGEPSDVYVGLRNNSNLPVVGDLFIRGRNTPSQCSLLAGTCIDGSQSNPNPNGNCANNAQNVNVTKTSIGNVNYTIVQFSRPLAASDTCDIAITPGVQTFLLAAMGPLSVANYPASILKHSFHSTAGVPITFNLPTTSGVAPVTTGVTEVTTGSLTSGVVSTGEVTTANPPVTSGSATSGAVTTGMGISTGAEVTSASVTTSDDESTSSAAVLTAGALAAIALTI